MRIIHSPKEVKRGKLYRTVSKPYKDTTLYLGCEDSGNHKTFLVIAQSDNTPSYVGSTVHCYNEEKPCGLWYEGFEELSSVE